MPFDPTDTIAAIASPRGGAGRGVVRLSGPDAIGILQHLVNSSLEVRTQAARIPSQAISIWLHGQISQLPCDVYLWPSDSSYTKQRSAELHTYGSPPLLESLLRAVCEAGARLAQPGEFTLRAFAAGRIDLLQAEAVLDVIDAEGESSLKAALSQLAGGLSEPLAELREVLLHLLAELEAGLDFVDEEDVKFLEVEELQQRLTTAAASIADLIEQTTIRGDASVLPRVVLVGEPNVGKSSLFNAIRRESGFKPETTQPAIVSPQAGTTRDNLSVLLRVEGLQLELIDTAGRDERSDAKEGVESAANRHSTSAASQADLRLLCLPVDAHLPTDGLDGSSDMLLVRTKADLSFLEQNLPTVDQIVTSSETGEGIPLLLGAIRERLVQSTSDNSSVTARCRQSLADAQEALERALHLSTDGSEDMVALELRSALDSLGDVIGVTVTDDILDRIFGQFCIGK